MKRSKKKPSASVHTGKLLSRRTLLRGAGSVAIALPLLDAMRPTTLAADPEPPARAFNLFFGLGFPTPLQSEEFSGPMEPLQSLSDKLCIIRGIHQRRADRPGDNAHYDGSASAFAAERPVSDTQPGGPTLDQLLRRHAYPSGLPAGVTPTVAAGTYFRRSDRPYRYLHTWNPDGSPAARMQESPRALFDRIFGEDPSMMEPGTPDIRRRSILDAVLGQYRHYQSDASNLGRASRTRIADHLDRVREHELAVFGDGGEVDPTCRPPARPGTGSNPRGDLADPGGQGIDITYAALNDEFRLLADLYALGIQCDAFRFGSLTYLSAGERIRLTGRHEFDGRTIYEFNDRAERGTGGSSGCSHEYWHDFNAGAANVQLRAHLHMKMAALAYFMHRLDEPEFADANGKTILENAMITISTESGDGRHNDVPRELSGIFHAITGANDRFATGNILDVGDVDGLDLYNTMLGAMGVSARLGPSDRPVATVDAILR